MMLMMMMMMMMMMTMMVIMMMMMVMMVEQEGVTSIACAEQPERPREAAEGPVSVPTASDGKSLPVAFTHFDTIAIIISTCYTLIVYKPLASAIFLATPLSSTLTREGGT